jgi:hypothetical protein
MTVIAGAPPTATVADGVKFAPVIENGVPPVVGPLVGEML